MYTLCVLGFYKWRLMQPGIDHNILLANQMPYNSIAPMRDKSMHLERSVQCIFLACYSVSLLKMRNRKWKSPCRCSLLYFTSDLENFFGHKMYSNVFCIIVFIPVSIRNDHKCCEEFKWWHENTFGRSWLSIW